MKKIIVLLLVLLIFILTGCKSNQIARIGIISAMDNEIDLLLQEAKIDYVENIGTVDYHVGTLHDKPVVISKSGIGKVYAASGATTMMNNYNISKIIFTGIAGGVSDETEILDVVVATRLVEHDYGILTNNGFEWVSGDPGFSHVPGTYYECDKDLVKLAYDSSVSVIGLNHSFKGVIATGDQFISSETYVQKLKDDYDAYACEMEGASVAKICINYNIPYIVIRALSDKADGNAHDSYENFGDIAASNSSKIVLKMIESL